MIIFFFCPINYQFQSGSAVSFLPAFGFLCLRNVPCFFSMPVIFLRPGQTLAAFNATSCNIVGQNMLHTFAHHVVICCNILDDVVSNLKTARFFVQHFGYWCCAGLATFIQLGRTRACVLGPVVACQGPGAHKHPHVATSGNNVVRCCVEMLRAFDLGFNVIVKVKRLQWIRRKMLFTGQIVERKLCPKFLVKMALSQTQNQGHSFSYTNLSLRQWI